MILQKLSNTPRLPAVIPSYSRRKDLARCMASFKRPDFEEFEMLDSNDGFTGNTAPLVESYSSYLNNT